MERYQDQEKRFYRNEEEIQRKAQQNVNQKRQMETLADPLEANKISMLQEELSGSRCLTEVADDFHLFEMATNKHFN